jgi:hypothetical protein
MSTRTTLRTINFSRDFIVGDMDEALPAGAYTVETDEQRLEGLSFLAYRRVQTLIHLPAKPGGTGLTRLLAIDPDDLDAALKRDRMAADA